jgi:arylsulfate sulfotransferase
MGMEDDTEDMIIEIERLSGKVAKEWDLRNIFDPDRKRLWEEQKSDWCHLNSIQYDSSDNTLLISSKLQYFIAKIDYDTGDIKWILGNHENWEEPWQPYLLEPLNFDTTSNQDEDWPYAQHMPRLTADNTIMVYDNGGNRPGGNYTRAVEYKVDPESMTVERLWSFEMDEFASALGSVHVYEDNSVQVGHGLHGIVYEVDRNENLLFKASLKSYYRVYPIKLY